MQSLFRTLFTWPYLWALLFALAKLWGLEPLVGWSWGWILSPIWFDWMTAATALWLSRELDRLVRFGIAFTIRFRR